MCRTAKILRLEHGKLKRMMESATPAVGQATAPPAGFLELVTPRAVGLTECVIELEGPRGKMRIQWKGAHGAGSGRTEPGTVGVGVIQITPQMRILVAVEAVDGRKGIDSLAQTMPGETATPIRSPDACLFSGAGVEPRSASWSMTAKGSGWRRSACRKGDSCGGRAAKNPRGCSQAHQAQLLLAAGNPETEAAPVWRKVS